MRRVLTMLLVGVLFSGAASAQENGYVAMSFAGMDIPLWVDILDLMEPMLAEEGYGMLTHDPQWDVARQSNDWDAWITRGVKAIMGWPVQPDALVPVTQRARAAGIPVIGYTQHWQGTTAAMLTNPLEDGIRLGRDAGEWIVERFGEAEVHVAVLGDRSTELGIGRTDGMIQGVQEVAPNAIVHELSTISRQSGYDNARRLLIAQPSTNVWISMSDENLHGAYRAVLETGVAVDDPDYFFGSLDVTDGTLDVMALPNSIWRIAYAFTSMELAEANVRLLVDSANGEDPEDIVVNARRVTQENLDEFYMDNYTGEGN